MNEDFFWGNESLNGDTIWLFNIAMENPLEIEVLMGKSSINGPFSMAMLNNQMVSFNQTMGTSLGEFLNRLTLQCHPT